MRATPPRDAPPARPPAPATWRLLICDDDRERADALATLAARDQPALGIAVGRPDDAWPASAPAHIALVTVEADSAGTPRALAFIREARRHRAVVLAHALDFEGWTVAQKCRPLIAGAARVLDGSARNFAEALRRALAVTLCSLTESHDEELHVCERLRALGVEGESAEMVEIFRRVLRFGPLSDLPVLLTGATGTGKERFTHALHLCDPKRARGPLVAVNCAALVPTLAESELFGHRRGAFTGAERDRRGLVRAAHGGVLFLDEIGDLELALQAKLLRVLQEGRVLGVGEEREEEIDVRVFAATNRQLPELVATGKFRADLYHRLSVLVLELPPLRGRTADIARLTSFFLRKYQSLSRAARHAPSGDFVSALCRLSLPGNVRQLENIVRQALVNKLDDAPLALGDLPPDALQELAAVEAQPARPGAAPLAPPDPTAAVSLMHIVEENDWNLGRSVRACEREVLAAALRRFRGNQTKAAGLLGVTVRSIYSKVRKLGLHA